MTKEATSELSRFRLLSLSTIMFVVGTVLSVYLVWWLMALVGWEFGYANGAEPLVVLSLSSLIFIALPISVGGKEVVAINVGDFRRAAYSSAAFVLLLLLAFTIVSGIHLFGLDFWFGATLSVVLPATCAAHIGYLPIYIHQRRKDLVS